MSILCLQFQLPKQPIQTNPYADPVDPRLLLECVREDAAEEPRADREVQVVPAAVQQQEGIPLFFASEELQADREVVLAAVQQNGRALKYASEELQADREVVLAAVQQNGEALTYASRELQAKLLLKCR